MTTYDQIPYSIHCYPSSAPEHMSAVAKLFGVSSAALSSARVLELGCASGGNLIPLAARYPQASFTGIDLSQKQIDTARSLVAELNLKNIEFEAKAIQNCSFKNQSFDFIIVHGVYSWVSSDVQESILKLCDACLSENGIAYVSYNTLPGWNASKTVRDMLLYHDRSFSEHDERILEAQRMLNFVSENITEATGYYKNEIDLEIQRIAQQDQSYLFHEYLEEVNDPCYFHEFMEKAQKFGLDYLGDADVTTMYSGNQKEFASNKLSQIESIVQQEQYIDFLTNRRFRKTYLVKNATKIDRNVSASDVDGLFLTPLYNINSTQSGDEPNLDETLDLVNASDSNRTATLKGKYHCACYTQLLISAPIPLTGTELVAAVNAHNPEMPVDEIQQAWNEIVLELLFRGIIDITAAKTQVVKVASDKPCVSEVARLIGLNSNLVPNMKHELIRLPEDSRVIMQYVNGVNTMDDICNFVKGHIDKGDITLSADGTPIAKNSPELEVNIKPYVDAHLTLFSINSLLVG